MVFHTDCGSSAVPPTGIPDREGRPYHGMVFELLTLRDRYMPGAARR